MTIACDLDHLGKRFQTRFKTTSSMKVSSVAFCKTDLARYMAMSNLISDAAEVERLFNPEDLGNLLGDEDTWRRA